MTNERDKAIFQKAAGYIEKYLGGVQGVQNALIKFHDAIPSAVAALDELSYTVQEKVMDIHEMLDNYTEDVWARVAEREEELYPQHNVTVPKQERKQDVTNKRAEEMSKNEKIDFLIKAYGLEDSSRQREALERSSDQALTMAVKIFQNKPKQQ